MNAPIAHDSIAVAKAATGISGLDQLTEGGFPRGRCTLVCGAAGCGKSLLVTEFLVRGAVQHGEPGVFVTFEESTREIAQNVRSLGFDLDALIAKKLLEIDHIQARRYVETGAYDLEGLFVRIGHAVEEVGARRIVLDTIEALFSGFANEGLLRHELQRLFRWLKDQELTAVITAERGAAALTRYGLEEYVSDCVILLDQRVNDQIATRRLRVVKYRGSNHGTNEYPFLIAPGGLSVCPITSLALDYPISDERVSTGIKGLDQMLGGQGFYRGAAVLITGTAGTGKSSTAAQFVEGACARGERAIYFALEEPRLQILRNMRSIGLDLARHVDDGRLTIHAVRPTLYGLEMHLLLMQKVVDEIKPTVVVIDPISSFLSGAAAADVRGLLLRLFDTLKTRGITTLVTSLASLRELEETEIGISSLMDTWLEVRDLEHAGERNRVMFIMKSRGMPHSNQVREFLITSKGIDLLPVYTGPSGVLTGSARVNQEAEEAAEKMLREQEIARCERELGRRRAEVDAQVAAIVARFEAERAELQASIDEHRKSEDQRSASRVQMASRRLSGRVPGNGV